MLVALEALRTGAGAAAVLPPPLQTVHQFHLKLHRPLCITPRCVAKHPDAVQAELQAAIKAEDYQRAARIRDRMRVRSVCVWMCRGGGEGAV